MINTRAGRVLKVLVISLVVAAISRGGVVSAATLPVVMVQGAIEKGLRSPSGIALGADRSLYVADPANQGVMKYTAAGALSQKIAIQGIPQGVALTADNRLLVSLKDSVVIYSASGTELGKLGAGAGQFVRATGIALDDAGLIYVTDSDAACVQVFASNGSYLSRFGVKGKAAGQLQAPVAIAFEKASRQLAIVDSLNGQVQFYDLNGSFVRAVGATGSGPLKFMHPQGVAFEYDANGLSRMYVSDTMARKVQVIDPAGTGTFLAYLSDNRDGQALPSKLAFDQTISRLYVLNGLGGVSVFQIINGSTVVNNAAPAAPTNAASFASTAQSAGATTAAAGTALSPFVLSTIADGSTVTGDTLDVSGQAFGVLSVVVNGQPVTVANGQFSTAVSLAAGANVISVAVTDLSGKVWTETRNIKRDSGVPVLAVIASDVQSTSAAVFNLKGSVDHTAVIYVSGAPADLNKLEWSAPVTLVKGLNTIDIQAVDLNGLASNQKRTIYFQPTAPDLAIVAPAEDMSTKSKKVVLKGTVTGADVKVSADVNGTPKQVAVDAGQFSLPVEFPQDGVYTVTFYADAGGDVSTVSRTIIYRAAK